MPSFDTFPFVLLEGSPVDLDGSILIQLAIFFIAFFILRGLVFRPVLDLFDAREQAMEGSRKQAAEMQQDADRKREQLESELRAVRHKASEDRDRRRTEAQKLARELMEKARRENAADVVVGPRPARGQAKDARTRTLAEVPTLARQIAEKLLGRSVH